MELRDGSRVGVVGGGPAASLFSYFLLDLADRVGLDVSVDLYEPKNFASKGPGSCNHCGGVISESLVQLLEAEGIHIPSHVIQRGIDSYVLHTDYGSVVIETPLHEMRIAAVHRGGGPLGSKRIASDSFDAFLLDQARAKGVDWKIARIDGMGWHRGRPWLQSGNAPATEYDLVVGGVGLLPASLKLFENLGIRYHAPRVTKTWISEIHLGANRISELLGSGMHVFLPNIPRLEFVALIPKGDYVTLCMLGERIDRDLVKQFLAQPQVTRYLPSGFELRELACRCAPRIQVAPAGNFYGDRVVMVGDCSVARLYKDGIGSAYRTAKSAALTAVFDGVSARDFAGIFANTCQRIERDNRYGKSVFAMVGALRRSGPARRAMLDVLRREQREDSRQRRLSMILWDTFSGSAPYRDIFRRGCHPELARQLTVSTLKNLRGWEATP